MRDPGATLAYTLRPATGADFAFLYDLHVACLREYVAQTWGWDEAVQRELFATNFAPARSQVVGVADEPIGALAVERHADAWFVANLAIAPAWQGRGLGAALLRDILATAAREGLPTRLRVLRVNPARRLYERLGFVIVGETPTHYLMERASRSATASIAIAGVIVGAGHAPGGADR